MQQDILTSTKKFFETAGYVSISENAIEKFCGSFSPANIITAELGDINNFNLSESVGLVCVFNCVNFCFWSPKGQEKWTAQIDGKTLDGATGMFRALEAAFKNGTLLLDANFLSDINRENFHELLNGNKEIPLLDERVKNLKEAGEVLAKNFGGNFMNILEAAQGDAVELTNIFIKSFPSFDDYAVLGGLKIEFHKRAQLNTDMINYRLVKKGQGELRNLDKLTAFADYKVPQMLRKFGILVYTPELAQKIDSYTEVEAGSRKEIEIRTATILAIEKIKEFLIPRYPKTTPRQLDDYLWSLGQTKYLDDKPYHRTRTIAY